jgi:hypothetical protein
MISGRDFGPAMTADREVEFHVRKRPTRWRAK